jgi:type IV pilus assembly protein PilA
MKTMSENSELLACVKPLADPLRVFGAFTLVEVLALLAFLLLHKTTQLALMCVPLSIGLAIALVAAPRRRPNAIYLRAFRGDRTTSRLRTLLIAVLGSEFRLSGIRPPRKKSSVFLRFFLPGIVALRYAGSLYMDLEAGDDWMARLWKTYQSTRVVFIDARDMTTYVHQEIRLTLLTMGYERCIFLIDDKRTEAEWRTVLSEIAATGPLPKQLLLLNVSPSHVRSGEMARDLRAFIKVLPHGTPAELDGGRQFILEHVRPRLLAKSGRPQVVTVVIAVLAIALSYFAEHNISDPHPKLELIQLVANLCLLLFLFALGALGILRQWRAAWLLGRYHRSRTAWVRSAATMLCWLAPFPLLGITFLPDHKASNERSAMTSFVILTLDESIYQSSSPTQSFSCSLAELSQPHPYLPETPVDGTPPLPQEPPSAAEIESDRKLAAGRSDGYIFAVTNCAHSIVDGHDVQTGYRITAVPARRGLTGDHGYCSDQDGHLSIDPAGGTNCTEPVP